MASVVVNDDSFVISTRVGEAEFKITSDTLVEVSELKGLYAKQPKVKRSGDPDVANSLSDHFDANVYTVYGEVPKYCPWAFAVDFDYGYVVGIDLEYRCHILEDKRTINVPAERISPGALTWPKRYYVEISPDGTMYMTKYEKILQYASNQELVDIKKRLYISVPKEEWVKLTLYP